MVPLILVVGFLGGFNDPTDGRRGVTQTAQVLAALPGVRCVAVSNHDRKYAIKIIRDAIEHDPDTGVVLFGQSLGGRATVKAARELKELGIPVLLTVQIDSVGVGANDAEIPTNVAAAANFFQRESWPLIGRKEIHAADPAKTRIIGNYQLSGTSHSKMEQDPALWQRVAALIENNGLK